ncbi:MAG: hypothetical protein MUE85_20030 [Microscillaceae bacterium]|jgi:hypothetical protein|nr:hypothetical protein [Microscillaceae bacterium]
MEYILNTLKVPLTWFKKRNNQLHSRAPLWWIKWTQYEYWDWYIFYLPILPYWLYLAIRARSLTYFTAGNPGIEMGGFFGESKKDILNKIPTQYLPKSAFISQNQTWEDIDNQLKINDLQFPLIAKPNVGERGNAVVKLESIETLKTYWQQHQVDFILQEFIEYPIELGVLFYRLPNEASGQVSSITLKNFLTATGDGKSSLQELLAQNTRARFQLKRLKNELGTAMQTVLANGEKRLLEPIGNHCRGTEFINANHLINSQLHQIFSEIALGIDGFYYGRFDLKVKSYEDLAQGKNIKIMELNGISSEPGHVYDTRYTLWQAYRDIMQHWYIIWKISRQNHALGVPYTSIWEILQVIKQHFFTKKKT